jgi:hypothetical protein
VTVIREPNIVAAAAADPAAAVVLVIVVTAAAGNMHITAVVHEPVTVSTAIVAPAANFNLSSAIAST